MTEFMNLFMFRQGATLSVALRSEYQIAAVEIVAYFTRLPWIAQEQLPCDFAIFYASQLRAVFLVRSCPQPSLIRSVVTQYLLF